MSNRFLRVQVRDRSLDPAQAELWVVAETARVTPTTELRGRLTGPQCLYSATVEVAYPLRPFPHLAAGLPGPAARVVIPEPSLWEPQCPFAYRGTAELWQDGVRTDQVELRHGLRRVLVGPSGLRVNGSPLLLRGRPLAEFDEGRAAALRRDGYNLLLAPAEVELWERADVYGFFVLERLEGPDEATLTRAERHSQRPSCLGWVLEAPLNRWRGGPMRRLHTTGALVGAALHKPLDESLPEGVDFTLCPSGVSVRVEGRPVLLLGSGPDEPGMIGRVE